MREETLVKDMYEEIKRLKARLSRETRRNGYLTRQIRKLKKDLSEYEDKRNNDSPKQKFRETRDIQHPHRGISS